jgi:hypothetical protein
MTIRLVGALLCGAALLLAIPTAPAQATTVKSSKSNTSDRMGGGGGKSTARAITVKNSSDRMGGGGGKGAASRAKSNTGDRTGGEVLGPPMGGMIFFGRRRF